MGRRGIVVKGIFLPPDHDESSWEGIDATTDTAACIIGTAAAPAPADAYILHVLSRIDGNDDAGWWIRYFCKIML